MKNFTICILLCLTSLFSCKVEDVTSEEKNEGLFLRFILIRPISIGEYTNNPSVTEMYLLFNNGLTAVVQDTIEGTEFNMFRKNKVDVLSHLKHFSEIESNSLVKRTTSYILGNDSLLLYFLPEGDKSMFFKNKFDSNSEYFVSKLFAVQNGSIHNTVDIIENVDKEYTFRIIKSN